jgi:putative ABC transport system substrate-binding protein
MNTENNPANQSRLDAFKQALAALGWIEGRSLRIDFRPISNDPNHLRAAVAELVGLTPDVIYTSGTGGMRPLRQATRTIPIVFTRALDPVAEGYVASLARPGGNMTGLAAFDAPMGRKWLQLLKQIAPDVLQGTCAGYHGAIVQPASARRSTSASRTGGPRQTHSYPP